MVQAVAKVNLIQPRNTATREPTCVDCGCRDSAELAKTSVGGEETVVGTRLVRRGPGDGMYQQTHCINWGPTRGLSAQRAKKISRWAAASGSDEAIVSDDLGGQHNRWASQGPLDGMSGDVPPPHMPSSGHRGNTNGLGRRISPHARTKVAVDFPFEAVLGKPTVRNFREGRENTMIGVRLADA